MEDGSQRTGGGVGRSFEAGVEYIKTACTQKIGVDWKSSNSMMHTETQCQYIDVTHICTAKCQFIELESWRKCLLVIARRCGPPVHSKRLSLWWHHPISSHG